MAVIIDISNYNASWKPDWFPKYPKIRLMSREILTNIHFVNTSQCLRGFSKGSEK